MNQIQAPIADFAVSYYLNNPANILSEDLGKHVTSVIDSIKSDVGSKGVDFTVVSFRGQLFDLKMALLPVLASQKFIINDYAQLLSSEIADKRNSKTETGKTISDILLLFDGVVSPFLNQETFELFDDSILRSLSYETLISLLTIVPDSLSKNLIDFLNLALEIDCALIISDLIFNDHLKINPVENKNLIILLKQKAEDFAILAIENKLLERSGKDICQIHRNAKIRIAAKELANNKGRIISSEELKTLLSA